MASPGQIQFRIMKIHTAEPEINLAGKGSIPLKFRVLAMRLIQFQSQSLLALAQLLAGTGAQRCGFDSRLDDLARSGDCDLMPELDAPVEYPPLMAARLSPAPAHP